MSLLLVLAAAVALVVGLLQSGLTIIYVSIGCSVVAGILLAVAVVRGRPDKGVSGPMPQPAAPAAPPPAPSPSWPSQQPAADEAASARQPAMAEVGASSVSDSTQQLDQAAIELAVHGDEDNLPIGDYDRLRATEVLPLLAGLDADELAQIRAHEVSGRNRFMVLSRIDRELEGRGAGDQGDDDDDGDSSEWDTDDEWDGADADDDEDEDDRPAVRASSILENYEQLKVLEILPRLADLNAEELAQVRRREQSGQRRAMIINRVDRLIVDAGSRAPAAPARRAPAKKSAATKAPAKKSAAKRAPAKRAAAAPAKKAAAKKAPAKKSAARSAAPAKKAPAKKAVAKKAPAKTTRATKKR